MTGRRGHGEGSIYRRKDGRWEGVIRLGWENGKQRKKSVYGGTQREVADKLRALRSQVARGLPVPEERRTVGHQLREWLTRGLSDGLSANTRTNYVWAVENHLVPSLGRIRLAKLSPTDVHMMLQRKADEGLSPSSRMRFRSVLVMALRHAEAEGLVQRNVAALVRTPSLGHREGRSLTVPEAHRLLNEVRGERLEAALVVMLTMGLRPGETMGLTWDCVDLDAGEIHVRQSLKREPDGLRLGALKTPKSRRSLRMPKLTGESLNRHRLAQIRQRLAVGLGRETDGLVFTTEIGTPVDPSNLRREMSRITERAGLGHWTPKELRHSAVSLLSASGVPLEEIADVTGHDSTRMTGTVYRHLLSPVVDSAADPMDRLFGESS